MSDLARKKCIPCEGNVPAITREEAEKYLLEISGWELSSDAKRISKKFTFGDFDETMMFVNQIAELAETEGHHPDLSISYSNLTVELSTHAIGGLSENDFILAAKIDELEV